ncbi:hypothetical protein [Pyxidicoccus caerfyrddinensis]|uniref:hypothetical protein n=1 Tax=Pyxidicoccus caerfyrddinensis TaxID=2709663 RepID=UPI0013DA7997|nr:hypothetical protein [Pyxidicoccus caerfyrddinensis]
MSRWWTGAVGLALGVCTALGCGAVDEAREPVQDEAPPPAPMPVAQQDPRPDVVPAPPSGSWRSGDPLWSVQVSLPGAQDVVGLASDGAGGFILLARTHVVSDAGYTGVGNLVLTRYEAMGMQLWSRTLIVTPGPSGTNLPQSSALAVSRTGDIFVALQVWGGGTLLLGDSPPAGDRFIAKFSADGTVRWARDGEASALAADGEGGVVAVTQRGAVSCYDAQGARQWTWTSPEASRVFTTVAVDPEGNIVAAGHELVDMSYGAGFILGLSPSGAERWWSTTPPEAGWANFSDLAILPDGVLLLTGTVKQSFLWGNYRVNRACATGAPCTPATTLLAADARGQPLWAEELEGYAISPRLAVSPDGDALVFWESSCNSRVMRLSPAGEVRWRFEDLSGPCTQDMLLPRDIEFLRDGTLVRAGVFRGPRTFSGGASFIADEGDLYLQRLNP